MRIINKNVNIIKYLPEFMQKFKEIQQITSSENIDLQEIWYEIDKLMNNQFIESCDLYGITLFEKLLGIIPNENISLETRKFNVMLNWNGDLPYTYRNLLKKLDYLYGKDSYTLEIRNKDYIVNIITSFIDENRKNILINSLKNIIPANMTLTNDNRIEMVFNQEVFISSVIAEYRLYSIGE